MRPALRSRPQTAHGVIPGAPALHTSESQRWRLYELSPGGRGLEVEARGHVPSLASTTPAHTSRNGASSERHGTGRLLAHRQELTARPSLTPTSCVF